MQDKLSDIYDTPKYPEKEDYIIILYMTYENILHLVQ